MSSTARIVICDDHPVLLMGLRNLIESVRDLEIVGTATNGLMALRVIRETNPDIAVVDISMPDLNGIALTRRLAKEVPSVKVVILTFHEERAFLKQGLDAGARGYLLKRCASENLVHAIRAVLTGGLYVDPVLVDQVFSKHGGRRQKALKQMDALTERENDVLKLTALGFTSKEAARQLAIGVKSVETYKARGMEKLALRTRAELVRYAATQGWLSDI